MSMKGVDHITGETEDISITQLGHKLFGIGHLRALLCCLLTLQETATPAFLAGL